MEFGTVKRLEFFKCFWTGAVRRKLPLFHIYACLLLVLPVVGKRYLPMVDLPGHLAIVRVLDRYFGGEFRYLLQLNTDAMYKPMYYVLLGLFEAVPIDAVSWVFVSLNVISFYAIFYYALGALTTWSSLPKVLCSFAMAQLMYTSSLWWGLLNYVSATALVLLTFVFFLKYLERPCWQRAKLFLAVSLVAHITHPLPTVFLGVGVASLLVAYALTLVLKARHPHFRKEVLANLSQFLPVVLWPLLLVATHWLSLKSNTSVSSRSLRETLWQPFHGAGEAYDYLWTFFNIQDQLPLLERTHFPVNSAVLLASALILALIGAAVWRFKPANPKHSLEQMNLTYPLGLLTLGTAALFLRHDLFQIMGPGVLWYEVRGTFVFAFFLGLLSLLTLHQLIPTGRFGKNWVLGMAIMMAAIGLHRTNRVAVQMEKFDELTSAYFATNNWSPVYRGHLRISLLDHIDRYECFYDNRCDDQSQFFYHKHPNTTIYPLGLSWENSE